MAINESKKYDPRMWARWEKSGAVGTVTAVKPITNAQDTLHVDLKGMYVFNPKKFDTEAEEIISIRVTWAKSAYYTPEKLKEFEERERKYQAKLRTWSQEFSGMVPTHWGEVKVGAPWHAILRDIEDPTRVLNNTEIEAAIKYPLWHVPRELEAKRELTPDQLELLASIKHRS